MFKLISIIITGIISSLYLFPFQFTFLPGINVKMMLAVVGLIMLGYQLARGQRGNMDTDFFTISILAIIFSLISLFSVTINGTTDYAYAGYIVSMWVWLSAAYALCNIIRAVHGEVSIELITWYFAAICVFQCIAALIIDNNESVKALVDTYISQGQDFLTHVKRLYGIGANLDVAGSRFSVVLILLMFLLIKRFDSLNRLQLILLIVCFLIIAAVGNMIARTTTVGLVLSLGYLGYNLFFNSSMSKKSQNTILLSFSSLTILLFLVGFYLYDTSPFFHKQIRFAFEGFFSLVEKGTWEVSSNETLKDMYVFPETLKTWIIGDGYFSSPRDVDPYFTGELVGGYYMGTDVGYLRFIFYSGILGLTAFSIFIIKAAQICIRKFPAYKLLFLMFLATNFIVWFKVSTDIFLVFAPFLMISKKENDAYEERLIVES